ncbi:hypothetical protein [Crossiella sp. CA198]|uniref:hypothetical protein n=1 Tax=Crossiella sp. CA198 TaxID=3455607 RepID=UPI003F8D582B
MDLSAGCASTWTPLAAPASCTPWRRYRSDRAHPAAHITFAALTLGGALLAAGCTGGGAPAAQSRVKAAEASAKAADLMAKSVKMLPDSIDVRLQIVQEKRKTEGPLKAVDEAKLKLADCRK